MPSQFNLAQVMQFMDKKLLLPIFTTHNRLEGRPRTHNFDRALKAEVRDALWMLTKQWQMGEFKGDDAGSPVSAKCYVEKTMLTKYQPSVHAVEGFDDSLPLETKVEQRKIPFNAGEVEISLDLRLMMGRHWAKLLTKAGFPSSLKQQYMDLEAYQIHRPDIDKKEDVYYGGTQKSWRKYAATATRNIDGKKLYDDMLLDKENHINLVAITDPTERSTLLELTDRFIAWFNGLFKQPQGEAGNDAWLSSNLEYQFACSAPVKDNEKVFSAKEYYHGHLDWYNFSIDRQRDSLGEVTDAPDMPDGFDEPIIRSFLPTPVQFDGMPNTRWWAFEDGKTNFGDISPDTTDINKLLLIEFGLVFANDWYLLPLTVPAGTIASIKGMSVKNVFGENLWIKATGRGLDDDSNRWTMYSMDIAGEDKESADLSLMVVPSVPKIQEGKPIEEIQLTRDEIANMVWGIETRIPLPSGESVPGREAGRDTIRYLSRFVAPPAPDEIPEPAAAFRYKVMSSVPENWIPFISTHKQGSDRETELQRGSMPRILPGQSPEDIEKVKPRTNLLREGLNQAVKQSYFINEEEVQRSGTRVTQSFQRTRWYNGQVFNWLGVRKHTGRGEASSHLQFDYLQPVKKTD